MPNPGRIQIFHCASGADSIGAFVEKALQFKRLERDPEKVEVGFS
jgi:hypothetical protein